MINNNTNILKKQGEILEDNQRTLNQIAKNNYSRQQPLQQENKQYDNVLFEIKREVEQMKKIKDQIERSSRQFLKNVNEAQKGTSKQPTMPNNIT